MELPKIYEGCWENELDILRWGSEEYTMDTH